MRNGALVIHGTYDSTYSCYDNMYIIMCVCLNIVNIVSLKMVIEQFSRAIIVLILLLAERVIKKKNKFVSAQFSLNFIKS